MKLFRTTEIDTTELRVGDVIAFSLNDGEEVEAMAVKQESDGMLFCLVNCLADEERMNKTDTNRGGYEASLLRKKLNTQIIYRFPDMLREKMVAFPNGDMLRLPTEKEIFGENSYGENEYDEAEQWEPMKLRRNRIAFEDKNGAWEWYWLQNTVRNSAARFAICFYYYGLVYCGDASLSGGVRPTFKIAI